MTMAVPVLQCQNEKQIPNKKERAKSSFFDWFLKTATCILPQQQEYPWPWATIYFETLTKAKKKKHSVFDWGLHALQSNLCWDTHIQVTAKLAGCRENHDISSNSFPWTINTDFTILTLNALPFEMNLKFKQQALYTSKSFPLWAQGKR
jgi:hypothetical protein